MNKSVILIMGGALIAAILVALVVQMKLGPKEAAPTGETTQILVAAKPLMTGENLSAENIKWISWPDNALFAGMIKKSDYPGETQKELYNAPLRRPVEKGEPITKQTLIADVKGGNNFLAASISPGMRAVAISVKATTTAGGFVAPGDHVDVLLSYSPSLNEEDRRSVGQIVQRYAAETIIYDVRVLAVDQSTTEETREAKVSKTVTLEVTPENAQVLALADRMGDLTLALRRIGEQDKGRKLNPLSTDAQSIKLMQKMKDMRSSTGGNFAVRVYSGSGVENVPVRVSPDAPIQAAPDVQNNTGD